MVLPRNEVAAENERRRSEETSKSPVGDVVEDVISVARPALAVGSALIASGTTSATELVVAGGIVGGLGIVDWFRKLGAAKVNENLESLGQATEDALSRVEGVLLEHGTSVDEIRARIESKEFKEGMASATLQALRTTQKDRLKRMALILANGVNDSDLEPEGLDDMMRAAVELKDADIAFLEIMYKSQAPCLRDGSLTDAARSERFIMLWPNQLPAPVGRPTEISKHRSSVARLQAHAFAQYRTPGAGAGGELVFLLEEGAKFYERLREIGGE